MGSTYPSVQVRHDEPSTGGFASEGEDEHPSVFHRTVLPVSIRPHDVAYVAIGRVLDGPKLERPGGVLIGQCDRFSTANPRPLPNDEPTLHEQSGELVCTSGAPVAFVVAKDPRQVVRELDGRLGIRLSGVGILPVKRSDAGQKQSDDKSGHYADTFHPHLPQSDPFAVQRP
jgi:hypothetical protein